MGLFDSLPTKIVQRSPSRFQETADCAADWIALKDGTALSNAVTREAYAGFIIGMLAVMTDEILGSRWSRSDLDWIRSRIRMAHDRLSPNMQKLAEVRLREIVSVHNLNWDVG